MTRTISSFFIAITLSLSLAPPALTAAEQDYVDITVDTPDRLALIEIKSYADARKSIREALGQILEYAYFDGGDRSRKPELFIAAPGERTDEINAYLKSLESKGLQVQYRTLHMNTSEFTL